MTEKVHVIYDYDVEIERTKVAPYIKGGNQYARVEKFVPREWLNEEVVIMRKNDFETLLRLVNAAMDMVHDTLLRKAKAERAIENSTKIKLSRDDFKFKLK